jgi:hypothetical protein
VGQNLYILVCCKDCNAQYEKRKDSIKNWNGRCRSCAKKFSHLVDPSIVEATKKSNTIHGDAKNKSSKGHWLYGRWQKMKRRCKEYPTYIAKNIQVCNEWRNNYQLFKEWAEQNGAQQKLELDRINNRGDYEPCNCRWITHQENCKNK